MLGQVSFKAVISQDNIAIDDIFTVNFILDSITDEKISNFKAPDFKDFKFVSKPGKIVRGGWKEGKRIDSKIYYHKIKALKPGRLTIGKAFVLVDSKEYITKSITLNVLSIEEKVATQATAFWNNKDKSKLILIDKNIHLFLGVRMIDFDRDKAKFYSVKNKEVTPKSINNVLPKFLTEHLCDIKKMKQDGNSILLSTLLLMEKYYVRNLLKPKDNEDLVFVQKLNVNKKPKKEEIKELEILKKYMYNTITYSYDDEQGRFFLKSTQ
ncbi:BatD family protein [Flavivirga aquimarina]|uniref:BatD family protein n=1 Tax=Flavivirga aquimarina TaxID=2027862 RepID=A0ABT8W814_9FLAO|nr:BatD family protein [Flavivirga aquimarina]MDO5969240.1 BatD family protein [Flavivirga aquimarina]